MVTLLNYNIIVILLLVILKIDANNNRNKQMKEPNESSKANPTMETVSLRGVSGPGCPYAAAWLTHVSLFCQVKW